MSVQRAVMASHVTELAPKPAMTLVRPLSLEDQEECLIQAYEELERKGTTSTLISGESRTIASEVDALRDDFASDDFRISDMDIEKFVREVWTRERCNVCFLHEDVSSKDPEALACEDCRMV